MSDRKPYAQDGEVIWPEGVRPEDVQCIQTGRAILDGKDCGGVTVVWLAPSPCTNEQRSDG